MVLFFSSGMHVLIFIRVCLMGLHGFEGCFDPKGGAHFSFFSSPLRTAYLCSMFLHRPLCFFDVLLVTVLACHFIYHFFLSFCGDLLLHLYKHLPYCPVWFEHSFHPKGGTDLFQPLTYPSYVGCTQYLWWFFLRVAVFYS